MANPAPMPLLHPSFIGREPGAAETISRLYDTTPGEMSLQAGDDVRKVPVIIDGTENFRIWTGLNLGVKLLVYHHLTESDEAWRQELPHIRGKQWTALSNDPRSLWSRVYQLTSLSQQRRKPYQWDEWVKLCSAGQYSWGDWTMPHATGKLPWRPSCWLNLRDAKRWPTLLTSRTLITRKQAKHFISSRDRMATATQHRIVRDAQGFLRIAEQPGVLHFDPRVQNKDDEKKLTFSLATAVERMPYESSVQAYVNAWPIKYLSREYLKWLAYDGQIGSEEGETETLHAPFGERANAKTVYQRYENGERLPTPQSMIRQMWTNSPQTKDGKLNMLHWAIVYWLKESECGQDSIAPLPEGMDGKYTSLWVSEEKLHSNAGRSQQQAAHSMVRASAAAMRYSTTDDLDTPEWREFYGTGRWTGSVERVITDWKPARRVSELLPTVGEKEDRWLGFTDQQWEEHSSLEIVGSERYGVGGMTSNGGAVGGEIVHHEKETVYRRTLQLDGVAPEQLSCQYQKRIVAPVFTEFPANVFINTGKSDSRSDPWANQGSPVWIMPSSEAIYKGMNRRGNRVRRAMVEEDDDPSPWQLGLVENESTGKPQVRDMWTGPRLEETLMNDYQPPFPSSDPVVNFRRAWNIEGRLETLQEQVDEKGSPLPPEQVSEEKLHQRELLLDEWCNQLRDTAPEWSTVPRKIPIYHDEELPPLQPLEVEIERLISETRERPDFSHMPRRGPHPSTLSILIRCETRAIRAFTKRQERNMKRDMQKQRRMLTKHLARARDAATDVAYELSQMSATPENAVLRDMMRGAAKQLVAMPEGSYGQALNDRGALYFSYKSVRWSEMLLPQGEQRRFEKLFKSEV